MSLKVTVRQLQDQLPELLDRAVENGEECIVQRNGKDYAVIVSVREWRRRRVGRRLDSLGPAYRLSGAKQARADQLLAKNQQERLSRAERRELDGLLHECDAVMLRRGIALDRLS